MWREVPPGVSSFHPPSPSSSFLPFFFFLFFSSCMRDKASCQTLKPPRSSSYRKLELLRGQEEQGRRWGRLVEWQKKKKRWSKDEGWCKGGNRVFACVCVLSSLLMNVKSLSEPRGILHIPQAYLLWLPLLHFPSHCLLWTMPGIPGKLSTNYLLNMFVHVGWTAHLIEGGVSTFPVLIASSLPSKQRRFGGGMDLGLSPRAHYINASNYVFCLLLMCFCSNGES